MHVSELENVILDILIQLLNADVSTLVKEFGMIIEVRELHPEKADFPKYFTCWMN